MKLLPLEKLGTREAAKGTVNFGLFLPWVSAENGNRMWVKVIHEKDQFIQDIQPLMFELSHSSDPDYFDYWSARVDINTRSKPHPRSAWGTPGKYVYRYCLEGPDPQNPGQNKFIDWIIDPFAREFGVGKLSAFTLGYEPYAWSSNELNWKTPRLDDLVMYELMINEFGGDIDKTIDHLDYLADMGVNCIEIMPVTNVSNTIDWGFLPIGYFGVDERFGKRKDLQRLIDEAHKRNIAVVIDSVYGHTSESFPYQYIYETLGFKENPFMGPFAKDLFGKSTDFHRSFTRDFFFSVNLNWLDNFHVDGFRYDCVPDFYDGPLGQGYADLTYETYEFVKGKRLEGGHWQRFFSDGEVNFIQCAEQLEAPEEVLEKTYTNCAWQDETLSAAEAVARGDKSALTTLGLKYGLMGFPDEVSNNGDRIKKRAIQYIENHDHSRFICNFRTTSPNGDVLLKEGDRSLWYKVQPYLIGMMTAKGIPMIWQGQEFVENYFVPDSGMGRTAAFRPVRWDYFYDAIGKNMVNLVRKLVKIRRTNPQFRYGEHFFYNDDKYLSREVILFSRKVDGAFSLTALNFSDQEQTIPFTFPVGGDFREELEGTEWSSLRGVMSGEERMISIPSNFGRIWTQQP